MKTSNYCALTKELIARFGAEVSKSYDEIILFSEVDKTITDPNIDLNDLYMYLSQLEPDNDPDYTPLLWGVREKIFNFIVLNIEPQINIQRIVSYLENTFDYNENLFRSPFHNFEIILHLSVKDHNRIINIGKQKFGIEFPYALKN